MRQIQTNIHVHPFYIKIVVARFEPAALNKKSSKDELANEDSKYIEEHEFHVEQDDAEAVADHHQIKAIFYLTNE